MSTSDIAAEARALLAQQLYSDAVDLLADHLDVSPDHTAAWELIAVAYSRLGDWESALAAMDQVLADKGNSALAWAQYGMALRKTRDFAGARKAQMRALTIDPDLELGIIELRKIKRDQGGRRKKSRTTERCPECGYALSPFDLECPRCVARNEQEEKQAARAAYAAAAQPDAYAQISKPIAPEPASPDMPYTPMSYDVAEAAPNPQYQQPAPFDPQFPQSPAPMPVPDAQPYVPDPAGLADAATARTFSIIGFFFAGIVFGILAIIWANRAQARGVNAGGAKTLGIVEIILGVAMLLALPSFISTLEEDMNASTNTSANTRSYGSSSTASNYNASASGQWTRIAAWSGNGTKNTQTFQVSREWAIEWATQPGQYGDGNFAIMIYSPDGQLVDLAANIIGAGHEQSYYHKAGTYYLEVSATQPWQVIVWDKR